MAQQAVDRSGKAGGQQNPQNLLSGLENTGNQATVTVQTPRAYLFGCEKPLAAELKAKLRILLRRSLYSAVIWISLLGHGT